MGSCRIMWGNVYATRTISGVSTLNVGACRIINRARRSDLRPRDIWEGAPIQNELWNTKGTTEGVLALEFEHDADLVEDGGDLFFVHGGRTPRSQALPGNALPGRLCLPTGPDARQSLAGSAFPGRAWEREEH